MENKVVLGGDADLNLRIDGDASLDFKIDGEIGVNMVGIHSYDHQLLYNRDAEDTHPLESITGLVAALAAKANTSDLASIAFTGSVNDLTQASTLYINCGTSTEVL